MLMIDIGGVGRYGAAVQPHRRTTRQEYRPVTTQRRPGRRTEWDLLLPVCTLVVVAIELLPRRTVPYCECYCGVCSYCRRE